MTAQSAAPAWRGWLAIAAAASCWGAGGAVAAVLFRTSGLGPVAVTFWRFAIAAAAYALLRPLRRSTALVPEKERSWRSAALTGGGMAVSQVAFFGAVETAGVTRGHAPCRRGRTGSGYRRRPLLPGRAGTQARRARSARRWPGSSCSCRIRPGAPGTATARRRPGLLCAVTYCAVTLLGRTGGGSGASLARSPRHGGPCAVRRPRGPVAHGQARRMGRARAWRMEGRGTDRGMAAVPRPGDDLLAYRAFRRAGHGRRAGTPVACTPPSPALHCAHQAGPQPNAAPPSASLNASSVSHLAGSGSSAGLVP